MPMFKYLKSQALLPLLPLAVKSPCMSNNFSKTLVSYGAMVFIFVGVWLGHWGKLYPWSLITSNIFERHLMA